MSNNSLIWVDHMKKLLISLLFLLLTINLFSAGLREAEPLTAITNEGKLIELYDIGRWEYIEDEIVLNDQEKNDDDEWLPLLEGSDILYNHTIFESLSSREGVYVDYILNNGERIYKEDWEVLKDFISVFQKSDQDYVLDTISKLYCDNNFYDWFYTIAPISMFSDQTAFIRLDWGNIRLDWGNERSTKIDINNINVNLLFLSDEDYLIGDLYKVKCIIDNRGKNLSYSIIKQRSYSDEVYVEFDLSNPENLELAREIAYSGKAIIEFHTDIKVIEFIVPEYQKEDLKIMYRLTALLLSSIDK